MKTMFNRLNRKTYDNSSIRSEDKSHIVSEQLVVTYNAETLWCEVTLSSLPRGDIISIVVFDTDNDAVIDGVMNVEGRVVKFLREVGSSFEGKIAEIKYLTES